ncbi:hypothetical protein RJ641_017301 [Dillenia turbinata]|uniref:EXPERA domain-containing protein n=1 Tax=Dillenia turbinata TaxID=194707 RepID=A0AAN8UQY1_9MAGN
MGVLGKLVDAILLIFFFVVFVAAPLIDSQTCLPSHIFPGFLVDLHAWYSREYGDYLLVEKPHFFVGLVWLELLFQWPLSLINIFGILGGKSWVGTTCLIYGVSLMSSLAAVMAEVNRSGKASEKLLKMYSPFIGFAVLAFLRGLFTTCGKSSSGNGRRLIPARKKRA